MSSGFDVDFDMSSDEISVLMKKYKKIKKYQKSNLFTIKTINGLSLIHISEPTRPY